MLCQVKWLCAYPPLDLIVNRPFIAHLSLHTRLKPTCTKKIGIMGLVYIFNQWAFNGRARDPQLKPRWPLNFNSFFHFLTLTKKIIEMLMKIRAKITIIVIENRGSYYFIIIYVKQFRYPYFLIRCWLQLLTTDEWSSYYKVCDSPP